MIFAFLLFLLMVGGWVPVSQHQKPECVPSFSTTGSLKEQCRSRVQPAMFRVDYCRESEDPAARPALE